MKRTLFRQFAGAVGVAILLAACCVARAAATDEKPVLRFNPEGRFKIVQFTDTHWNEDAEKCRKTLEIIDRVLDQEKPDFVMLTGDIITLPLDPMEGWKTITEPMARRKIPWAAVLGNHDDERHGVGRRELVRRIAALPYSLTEEGPEPLGGTGNYVLRVEGRDGKPAATLYCLDSRAYPTLDSVKRCKDVPQYGWFSFDQVQWFRQTSRDLRAADGDQKVPALAFFHIPVQEYAHPVVLKTLIGSWHEKDRAICMAALNTGMFAAFAEEGDILGMFVGHDHDNDYAGSLFGACLAYGRCSGIAAYGDLPRGGRVIELSEGNREFETWIREAAGPVVHRFRYPEAFERKK